MKDFMRYEKYMQAGYGKLIPYFHRRKSRWHWRVGRRKSSCLLIVASESKDRTLVVFPKMKQTRLVRSIFSKICHTKYSWKSEICITWRLCGTIFFFFFLAFLQTSYGFILIKTNTLHYFYVFLYSETTNRGAITVTECPYPTLIFAFPMLQIYCLPNKFFCADC